MNQPSLESILEARRKGVRRTALVMGGVALAFFVLSLLQMYK